MASNLILSYPSNGLHAWYSLFNLSSSGVRSFLACPLSGAPWNVRVRRHPRLLLMEVRSRLVPIYLLHQTQILLALTFFLIIKIASSEVHHAAISMTAHACGAVLLYVRYLTLRPASSQACAKKNHNLSLTDLLCATNARFEPLTALTHACPLETFQTLCRPAVPTPHATYWCGSRLLSRQVGTAPPSKAGGDACVPRHNAHSVEHILPKIAHPIVQKSKKIAHPIVQ